MKIGILGAGPAGIFAALKIRNITMNDVYLFDANPGIGRKLSTTGSGRCNITNLNITPDAYFSFQPADLSSIINRYPPAEIRKILEEEGIPTTATDDGWVYPLSFSAGNVIQILRDNLLLKGVNLIENTKVLSVQR
ncbi:MAG: NAD(P)/FAD-dependent oxidoreductase, partial [Anaerolineaceae bacterium]